MKAANKSHTEHFTFTHCRYLLFTCLLFSRFLARVGCKAPAKEGCCPVMCCSKKTQWASFSANELSPLAKKIAAPYLKLAPYCSKGEECAKNCLKEKFTLLNDYLATRTYLGDERVRACDFVVAGDLYALFTAALEPEFVKPFPHLVRWFMTIANQPAFKEAFGETKMLAEAPAKPFDCSVSIADAQFAKFKTVLDKYPTTCEIHKAKAVLIKELDNWLIPVYAQKMVPVAQIKDAKSAVRSLLVELNKYLATRTFFSTERLSHSDIVLAALLMPLYKDVMEAGFIKQFVHLNRWFKTVINQPAVKEVVGEFVFCTKEMKAPEPPKEKKEAPKKEAKKEVKKEAAEEEAAPKKAKTPMDLLPPSSMDLDAWKRCYSNTDTRTEAIPYFWKNYDAEGYSLWFCRYKYEVEFKMSFQVANLVSGMMQRMEHLHKYCFGSVLIFGNSAPYEISGVWMIRGHNFKDVFGDVDDAESYEWRELDIANPADKKLVEDYWAWDGELGGQKLPVNQGKNFK